MFVDFDPNKHKDSQLYELQTKKDRGLFVTEPIAVNVSFDQAAQTPWYYVVDAEEGSDGE